MAPKKAKAAASDAKRPFTIEVHGDTIDLDLKVMLDPIDSKKSKSRDFSDVLVQLAERFIEQQGTARETPRPSVTKLPMDSVQALVKRAHDHELLAVHKLVALEIQSRESIAVDDKPVCVFEAFNGAEDEPTSA